MKKIYYLTFTMLLLLGCKTEDDITTDDNSTQNEIVSVAERIEFSRTNIIPSNLSIVSYEGETIVGNSSIPEPTNWNNLEILIDENDTPLFYKRTYPNYNSNKINSTSTILFLATFNTAYNQLPSSTQSEIIDAILVHPIFNNLVEHLNQQTVIDLFNEYITENLILLTTDVFDIDLTINNDNFPIANISYNANRTTIDIQNPTNNFTAYGIYDNNILTNFGLFSPNSTTGINLPSINTNYNIRIMSGENASMDLYGNLQREEIEAFNADMAVFLDEAYSFILGPFDLENSCFVSVFNEIYELVDIAQECSGQDGHIEGVFCAINLGLLLFTETLLVSDDCNLINLASSEKTIKALNELIGLLEGAEIISEIAVKIQDFYLYENEFNICLRTDGTGVFECIQNDIEPAYSPIPIDGATDVTLNGFLSYVIGNGTPPDATFRIFFDQNPSPSFVYNLGSGQTNLTYENLEPNSQYYWKVQTLSSSNEILAESPIWSFTTESSQMTVTDIDGNIYETIQIGNQIWMAENLRTTRFRNGDAIPTGLTNNELQNTNDPAYVTLDENFYGHHYNWFTFSDSRGLCPQGFRVPVPQDLTDLNSFLQGDAGKLKSTSALWTPPNTGASNTTGFTAEPAGQFRFNPAQFHDQGTNAIFWTSVENSSNGATHYGLSNVNSNLAIIQNQVKVALRSCRCIQE